MKKYLIPSALFSLAVSARAQSIPVPTGRPITIEELLTLGEDFGGFLLVAGSILMYMLAGSSQQRLSSAKAMFKAGIIGALVLFSAGVIIRTIQNFAENPLFFFGG